VPETVPPEAGEVVTKGNIQALADAALSLLCDPPKLKAKGAAARALVLKRNMPEAVFSRYEQLYEQCAG